MNEKKVIKLALAGDQKACEEIYRTCYPQVSRTINRAIHNSTVAEDMTQEVMVRVFLKLHLFRKQCKLSTWIHRITINNILMYWRAKTPMMYSLDGEVIHQTSEQESGKIDTALRTDDLNLKGVVDRVTLDSVVRKLTPGCRKIFVLRSHGYLNAEIAKVLGISVPSVKAQYFRARKKLRMLLTEKVNA